MVSRTASGRGRLGWGALAVAGLMVLVGVVFLGSRAVVVEERWEAIETAADRQRWSEAEQRLGRWLRTHPDDDQAWVMLAMMRLAQGRDAEARAALEPIGDDSPVWVQARTLRAELAIREHRAAEAERILREVAARDPWAIEPRQRLIFLLSLQQRTAEARDVLWQMYRITRDPRHLSDLVLELWAFETDVRGLGPQLEPFVAQTPDDPFLRRVWGLGLLVDGRFDDALPHLEAAAEALENDPVGRFALAECRLALGLAQDLEDPAILGPRPASAAEASRWWVLKSRLHDAQGDASGALASLRQAVAANPEDHVAQFRLGQALIRQGQPDEAQAHLEQARAIQDRHEALKDAHRSLRPEGSPSDAERFERLGRLCLDAGLSAEARAWFEQAIRVDPTRSGAQEALARLADVPDSLPIALPRPVLASASPTLTGRPDLATTPVRPQPALRFEDITAQAGIAYQYDSGERGDMYLGDTMGGGVALLDFDNDGWLDIYFINSCRLPYDPHDPPAPNRLYRNNGDGTFRDVTEAAGVGGRGYGMGCAVGDFDNDGYDDLFLTGLNQTVLYRNNGDGTFSDVTEAAGVRVTDRWTTAAGFADLDGDGLLDLYVVSYVAADPDQVPDCRDPTGRSIHCSPRLFSGQFDLLFRNNGDGTFTDVSREAGIEVPDGRGLGLALADLDGDGLLDIFVANDLCPDFLFRNRGGLRFEEVGLMSGVAYNGTGRATSSMGVVAEDLDEDGQIDLFITNFINESNTLFRNLGDGFFQDVTFEANLNAPSLSKTGFGTAALDVDNDGVLDLFVANGHVDDQPWINSPMAQVPQLYRGLGQGRFAPVGAETSPYLVRAVVGRGAAAGDLDNDGRVDLVVVHRDQPAIVLRNVTEGGHWLGLRLRGTASGRSPVGARVTCRAGGRTATRWLTSGTSYLSVNDPRLWFGLGEARTVDHLEITWPSGTTQSWSGLPANRIYEVEEGREIRALATSGTSE